MSQDYLKDFYEGHCDEDARLRSRHGMVEFLTTMRYIERYLKPGGKILEIGAGTGRYSHALAQKGYTVDAVELLEHNIEVFRRSTLSGEPVSVRQGNALDLSGFGDAMAAVSRLLAIILPPTMNASPRPRNNMVFKSVTIPKKDSVPPTIYITFGIPKSCFMIAGPNSASFEPFVTRTPVDREIRREGIWLTRPSPMVRMP